jgi:hypothetical protein
VNYTEFKRHLGKAGYTAKEFAALIHVCQNTVTNYKKNGQVPQTYAVIAVLLGVITDAHKGDSRSSLAGFGVEFDWEKVGFKGQESQLGNVTQLKLFQRSKLSG